MKKFLLIFAVTSAMFTASAQEVIFEEEFEAGIPTTWLNVDADGDQYVWESSILSANNSFFGHQGDDGCVFSNSFVNYFGALNPDNWLITPQIALGEGCTLKYYVAGQDPNYASEHYGVYVSETGTDTGDFAEVMTETLPNGTRDFYERTVDLSNFAGKNVYIAFRHFDISDMYILKLDGISITSQGEPSAVNDIETAEKTSNVWVDLQGRKFDQKPEAAGIYINNGKKVIIK